MPNAFKPLTTKEKSVNRNVPQTNQDDGIAITPIPSDVALKIPRSSFGVPSIIWNYPDEEGRTLYKVCRFITSEGKKVDLPLTYREYQDGRKKWAWKGLDAPRPLYGLDRLANNSDAPVIVCEGEKAADGASNLFLDHVCITSPNGANCPDYADWTPLRNRDVTIWPDNDDAGYEYAQKVAGLLKKSEAKTIRIVQIPDDFKEKWDLADELPEGRTLNDIQKLLDEAEQIIDPLDKLLERIKAEGIGVAYTSEVVDALMQLSQSDRPAFMELRHQLKKAHVGVTLLDQSIQQRALETGELAQDPDHLGIAREVIDMIGFDNILASESHVWIWLEKGVWEPTHERVIKQHIQQYMEEKNLFVTRGQVDSVVDILQTEVHRPEHDWNTNSDTINVLNGELVWVSEKWELRIHCREHYRTTQIPVIYDPAADCPLFKKFLAEIFENDIDAEEKIQAILEMMGYTLVSHALLEKFILLIGPGANGKSVLMEIVRALVGTDNVAAVQPSKFSDSFQRAYLHLKLANLVTEIAEGGQIADAELKAITSGELTTVEHKFGHPFSFKPFSTCWFGANHMPHTRDFSEALFRRALVVPFNRIFRAGVDANPNLKNELLNELPGIMNLALEAFGGVLKRGNFTEPQSCIDAKEAWRKEVDQVVQFVEEKCALNSVYEIASAALYQEYQQWCLEAGVTKKLGRKNFTNRLIKLGCELHKGAAGKRMIKGIRLGWEA